MSAWLLPSAAAAFWAGLLASPVAGPALPAWAWLLAGAAAIGSATGVAPGLARDSDPDPLRASGLAPAEPAPLSAIPSARATAPGGRAAALALLAVVGIFLLAVGWGAVQAHRVEGSLLGGLSGGPATLEGTLATDPSAGTYGWSAVLKASRVRWRDGTVDVRESVWLQGRARPPDAVRGDRVVVGGGVARPDDAGFLLALHRRGIAVEVRVSSFVRLGASAQPFVRAAQSFRAFVGRSIARLFPPREAGLLMGLALGDDAHLDPGLARDFQATGLGHLLVVSGENVAMVLGPVLGLALALRLSRVPRFLLGLGTVAFFVVLTGGEPSVMRAGVMAALALGGVLLGRPRTTGSILGGAVLILLVLDPTLVWSIGFQLSVAATAGMVILASPLADRLQLLPRPVALAAGTTLAAQAGVTPALLFHFHEVPGITVLANLLAFPAVSPALVLGLLAGALGLAFDPLAHLVAGAALVPLRYLEAVADRLARAPVPWLTSGGGLVPLLGGAALVWFLAWRLRSARRIPRAIVALACALLPLFVWSTALSAGPPSGLVIHFLSVGEGDAALVTSPGGSNILIDGGPDPEQVATKLSALGVKRLDVAIASHPHADHIVGFPAVFARFRVGLLLEPGCPNPSPIYANLLLAARDKGIPVAHPRAGDAITVGDLHLDVLSPPACFTGTDSDPNNDALVVMMEYREDRVLFATEPEEPAQQVMLDHGDDLRAEVLKVPHHGGATSLPEFFQAVHAELAVVSVGPNDYGHPVPDVLDEIAATGAKVLRTDQEGDITVTFSPNGLLVQSAA